MRAEKQHSDVRQKQIARAAMALIAEQGMKGLSVASVARRIGLVPSALYRHFKGKDDILEATIELVRDRLSDNIRAIRQESSTPLEQLKSLLIRHIQTIREFRAIPRIIFSDEVYAGHPQRKVKIYKIIQDYLGQVADLIALGQKLGQINRILNPETISVMFLGLVQPQAVLWHLSDGKFDVTKQSDQAWAIFEKAIQTPKLPTASIYKRTLKGQKAK
jgi:AcrR family transcriptional regulator